MAMHGKYMYAVANFHVCLSEFLYSDRPFSFYEVQSKL